MTEKNTYENDEIIELPIDGVLDLHTFAPREVKDLVKEYLRECLRLGIFDVRIIHGKGKGVLRRTVHSTLDKLDFVVSHRLDSQSSSSWGATLVVLKRPLLNQ